MTDKIPVVKQNADGSYDLTIVQPDKDLEVNLTRGQLIALLRAIVNKL